MADLAITEASHELKSKAVGYTWPSLVQLEFGHLSVFGYKRTVSGGLVGSWREGDHPQRVLDKQGLSVWGI